MQNESLCFIAEQQYCISSKRELKNGRFLKVGIWSNSRDHCKTHSLWAPGHGTVWKILAAPGLYWAVSQLLFMWDIKSQNVLGWKCPHSPSSSTPCHGKGHLPQPGLLILSSGCSYLSGIISLWCIFNPLSCTINIFSSQKQSDFSFVSGKWREKEEGAAGEGDAEEMGAEEIRVDLLQHSGYSAVLCLLISGQVQEEPSSRVGQEVGTGWFSRSIQPKPCCDSVIPRNASCGPWVLWHSCSLQGMFSLYLQNDVSLAAAGADVCRMWLWHRGSSKIAAQAPWAQDAFGPRWHFGSGQCWCLTAAWPSAWLPEIREFQQIANLSGRFSVQIHPSHNVLVLDLRQLHNLAGSACVEIPILAVSRAVQLQQSQCGSVALQYWLQQEFLYFFFYL